MKTIIKYQANDGSEYTDPAHATARDELCLKVDAAMRPLGDVPERVRAGDGWVQHNLETVNQAKDAIMEICRATYINCKEFNHPGRTMHPLSIIGRILDDIGGPLASAWGRFGRIDAQGREHQQQYFAYTNGPRNEHVCVEDRAAEQSNATP